MEPKFIFKYANSRKNLIDFTSEFYKGNILEEIVKCPIKWIEELSIINSILTGQPLVARVYGGAPDLTDRGFKQLKKNIYLCSNSDGNQGGLWISKKVQKFSFKPDSEKQDEEWTHYRLGSRARIRINKGYENVSIEDLLPENFGEISEVVKDDKSPIHKFSLMNEGAKIGLYAKGSLTNPSFYYDSTRPNFRITNLASIMKVTSKKELEITEDFAQAGIKVPDIIGYYESAFEEFLFLKEVKGKSPDKCFQKNREEIIKQDAIMLARMLKKGYRKVGFADFDDKVFDGKHLYLIDVEEASDLYRFERIDFRALLLDPGRDIGNFRKYQKSLFMKFLKDAVYNYKDNMLSDDSHKIQYVNQFLNELGMGLDNSELSDLLKFPDNYVTYDSEIAIMCDTD